MMRQRNRAFGVLIILLLFGMAGCGDAGVPVNPVEAPETAVEEPATNAPQETAPSPEEIDIQPADVAEAESILDEYEPLPAEPQPVTFETADGRTLEGLYYPPKSGNAPVVVLMHWAPGSMQDWAEMAAWLQNRLDEVGGTAGWFPPMPAEVSFAVMAFNFGNYGSSEYGGSWESYTQDAQAALEFAASLHETDPHRVISMGASIGADGAVDGCYLFNDAGEGGTCIGALSLSPGNYLTGAFTYADAAGMIDRSGFPVWCLAAVKDYESPDVCRSISGEFSRTFIFPGGAHGMDLISPEEYPDEPLADLNTMQIIQEFLETATGIPLNEFYLP